MDTPCRTASHNNDDRITIARLSGAIQRLAYPLYRGYDTYNEQAAIAELQAITRGSDPELVPHLLAHATSGNRHFLHPATRHLLLAAGADQADLDRIAAHIDRHSPMPH